MLVAHPPLVELGGQHACAQATVLLQPQICVAYRFCWNSLHLRLVANGTANPPANVVARSLLWGCRSLAAAFVRVAVVRAEGALHWCRAWALWALLDRLRAPPLSWQRHQPASRPFHPATFTFGDLEVLSSKSLFPGCVEVFYTPMNLTVIKTPEGARTHTGQAREERAHTDIRKVQSNHTSIQTHQRTSLSTA